PVGTPELVLLSANRARHPVQPPQRIEDGSPDTRHGERLEGSPELGVIPVHRVDEADDRVAKQVLLTHAAPGSDLEPLDGAAGEDGVLADDGFPKVRGA